jgi:Flp pilus assembly protein TadD
MKFSKLILIAIVLVVVVAGYVAADWYSTVDVKEGRQYVGRISCADCHQKQCEEFVGSHHDKAMDLATEDTVLADFGDVTLEHYGITSRMFRDGDRFMINTEGPDGQMQDFEVKYVFGVEPLQQYMVEIDRPQSASEDEVGRVQVLRVSWDTEKAKWFFLSPPDVKEKLDVTDPLHWTGVTQNWNTSCAECHSTNLQKNYQLLTNEYKTTFSEIDVSCEACHGPASLHVDLAGGNSLFWDRKHGKGLAKLKTPSNLAQVQSCAPCHSRRAVVREGFVPGCNFDDYYALQLLNVPVYHADGQIRDEDYVYGSFLQSKMFHNGIRCSDCHNPHSANLIHTGNQVCTSCHQHPAGKYDNESHHHHKPGTAGAACVNCHMPATTYMDVDSRRDHSFRVPRPELSLSLNTPNACTGCHLGIESEDQSASVHTPNAYLDLVTAAERGDQDAETTLRKIDREMVSATKKWYPTATSPIKTAYYADLSTSQTAILDDASGNEDAASTLIALAKDVRNPALFRATALDVLSLPVREPSDSTDEQVKAARRLLNDSDIKVASAAITRLEAELNAAVGRAQSAGSASAINQAATRIKPTAKALGELLETTDSWRLRIEVSRALSNLPEQLLNEALPTSARSALAKGLKDYESSLRFNNDRAGVHLVAGSLYERLGRTNDAIASYRNAMAVQPDLTGPRSNLAALLDLKANQFGAQLQQLASQNQLAESQREALIAKIALLNQQAKDLRAQEHVRLGRDVKRGEDLAGTHFLHYRFGMSCYLQGDMDGALTQLKLAVKKSPDDPTYLLGLATFYVQVGDTEAARPLVEKLLKLDPDNASYGMLMKQVTK